MLGHEQDLTLHLYIYSKDFPMGLENGLIQKWVPVLQQNKIVVCLQTQFSTLVIQHNFRCCDLGKTGKWQFTDILTSPFKTSQ